MIIKKSLIGFFVLSFILFSVVGCSNEGSPTLTRVYYDIVNSEENTEGTWMIIDEQSLTDIDQAFKEIKWDPNTMPSMSREEVVKVTLFRETDKNLPERLDYYSIWFNADETATIISENESEGFGNLEQEQTQILKEYLLNTTDRTLAP